LGRYRSNNTWVYILVFGVILLVLLGGGLYTSKIVTGFKSSSSSTANALGANGVFSVYLLNDKGEPISIPKQSIIPLSLVYNGEKVSGLSGSWSLTISKTNINSVNYDIRVYYEIRGYNPVLVKESKGATSSNSVSDSFHADLSHISLSDGDYTLLVWAEGTVSGGGVTVNAKSNTVSFVVHYSSDQPSLTVSSFKIQPSITAGSSSTTTTSMYKTPLNIIGG